MRDPTTDRPRIKRWLVVNYNRVVLERRDGSEAIFDDASAADRCLKSLSAKHPAQPASVVCLVEKASAEQWEERDRDGNPVSRNDPRYFTTTSAAIQAAKAQAAAEEAGESSVLTPWMEGALQAMRVPHCADCGGKPGDHAADCTRGDLAIRVPCTRPCPAGCAGDSTPESCPVCLGTGFIDVDG